MESQPPFSEDEKTAVLVLLGRYNAACHNRAIDQEALKTIAARVKHTGEQIDLMVNAFAVFGFDIGSEGVWEVMRQRLGADRYYRTVTATTPLDSPLSRKVAGPAVETAAAAYSHDQDDVASASESVREQVLKYLEAAGEKGAKASEIRALVEARRGTELHSKTIGMTLYRLSQDALARREGITWFFVPRTAEKKNPGGETPGPNNVFD